jgi:hypothetical protein
MPLEIDGSSWGLLSLEKKGAQRDSAKKPSELRHNLISKVKEA